MNAVAFTNPLPLPPKASLGQSARVDFTKTRASKHVVDGGAGRHEGFTHMAIHTSEVSLSLQALRLMLHVKDNAPTPLGGDMEAWGAATSGFHKARPVFHVHCPIDGPLNLYA